MKINFENEQYTRNKKFYEILNDLKEGTPAVKEKGKEYLFQLLNEDDQQYAERLKTATILNSFQKTLENLNSILLRKPFTLDYKAKDKRLLDNIDGEGSSINEMISESADLANLEGMGCLFVDNQKAEGNESKADIFKPYLKNVKMSDIINFRITTTSGFKKLSMVVIKQSREVFINDFESKIEDVWIVLKENEGLIYKKVKNGFEEINQWNHNLGYVPIFPYYSKKKKFMEAYLPLIDLGYMNLKHYNKESDLDYIEHIASQPILAIFSEYDFDNPDKIARTKNISTSIPWGIHLKDKQKEDVKWVEITGSSISNLTGSVLSLESKMDKISLSILNNHSFNTATEARIADSNSKSFLLNLSNSIESAYNAAFRCMGDYLGQENSISLEMNKDFDSLKMDPATIDKIIALKDKNLISIDTVWDKLVKGEVINIDDYDLEKQKIRDEISEI